MSVQGPFSTPVNMLQRHRVLPVRDTSQELLKGFAQASSHSDHMHLHPSRVSSAPEGDGEKLLAARPVHERGGDHRHEHIHDLHAHAGQRCIGDARLQT